LNDYVRDASYKPITVTFQSLQSGFENTVDKQNVVAKMKSLEMKEVESTGYLFSLSPISQSESSPTVIFNLKTDDVFNFQFYYSRSSKKGEPSASEVKARLQDMQIVLQAKPTDPEKETADVPVTALPNIQEFFQRIVNLVDSKREEVLSKLEKLKEKEKDILTLKENIQKIKFDLRWSVEMGDCEVSYLDADGRPRGGFKVNNNTQVNKMMNKFIETENLLVDTKLGLATQVQDTEGQLEDLRHKVKLLDGKLKSAEAAKLDAEEKYVKAKMEFSEMAMKYNDLEIKIFQLTNKK